MTSTSGADFSTSTSSPLPHVPVTLDSKGRVRVSKEQRRLVLAEFERSGISAVQFAKRSGIKYSTFAGWLQRQRRAKPKGQSRAVRLLEAVVAEAQGGDQNPSLTLQLPDGAHIEISNPKQVALAAELLRALAKSC